MHDIRAIRETPELYARAWSSKGLSGESLVAELLGLDETLRAAQTALQAAQAERNEASKKIGQAKAQKNEDEAQRLMAHVETLKRTLEEQAEVERTVGEELRSLLATLPNIPAPDVPKGAGEHDNVEARRWGEPFAISAPKDHVDLGEGLGLLDFEAAARMSGSRFVVLKGQLARLERAVGQFMLDLQTEEHGYIEVAPPLLVNDAAAYGTDKLPKFADDLFQTTDGRWLIPTAEVPLTSLVMDQVVAEEELPLRFTALTPCFRSEAGASGRDTRGMIRQHQFNKVELVSITAPEKSDEEHERMVGCAEAVLKRLELPFRTMLLCTGDMGFGARKTYDLEVWLPSQGKYREISSCSNTGDFQARRMNARSKKAGEKGTRFVHTLNGSGLAVGRTLVAIMENYQDEDGRIAIPQALHRYLPGLTHIGGKA
ncbi:serine--tRNA ligase [Phenylobacterium sp. J367]|uniref:serine--tRNA ligase n=1 Tax=Phenylobacterium sp. J367 TaxID=2898435 RepID=UPI002150E7C1|nr:serine--tRNA ligase [Phenylobacterium sp. J367]MCR5879910.1 serine--tRNA ligase [Phenylobacterium sp. J367]